MGLYIKFSEMYDKLHNREVGKVFTTYRGYKTRTHKFYYDNQKNVFDITVGSKGTKIGKASLDHIDFRWSDELDINEIKAETYKFYAEQDWMNLMHRFYSFYPIFLIGLHLTWVEVY